MVKNTHTRLARVNLRASSGAALIELATILALIIAVNLPIFLMIMPRIGIADRRSRIELGFSKISGHQFNLAQMNLEGLMEAKDGCNVMEQLYKSALRLHQHTGEAGFCSVALQVDIDDQGAWIPGSEQLILSADENGNDCTPSGFASLPPNFVAKASSGLSADLARTQLTMGTFITDPAGPLMTKQHVVADASSDGPGVVSTSCTCFGGQCV